MKSMIQILRTITMIVAFGFFSLESNAQQPSKDNADWMSQNKAVLSNLSLNQIPILGAHDASSCYLKEDSPPATGYLEHSGKHLTHLPGADGVSRGKTQSSSITHQLEYGVRYLVLPIAHQDGQYWTIHMWLTKPLFGDGGLFQEILAFLNNHPDEIIILNMRAPLFSDKGPMNAKQEVEFYKQLYSVLNTMLVPQGDWGKTTLGQIWQGAGRLVILGNPEGDNPSAPFIWDENQKEDVWMDSQDPAQLMDELTDEIKKYTANPDPSKLFVLQGMTTTRQKLESAAIVNSMLREKLDDDWKDYPINVIQVDDAAKSGLMPHLLKRIGKTPQK